VQRFRGGLVFKAHRLCVSLNSRLESNKEEEDTWWERARHPGLKLSYRGTSLTRNTPLLGPYSRTTSRVHVGPRGGGLFLMREVLL